MDKSEEYATETLKTFLKVISKKPTVEEFEEGFKIRIGASKDILKILKEGEECEKKDAIDLIIAELYIDNKISFDEWLAIVKVDSVVSRGRD